MGSDLARNIIYIMRNALSGVIRFVGSAWQWLLSVFLILVLLLRIVPLVDSIENFEALRDTILSKQVCVGCRCLRCVPLKGCFQLRRKFSQAAELLLKGLASAPKSISSLTGRDGCMQLLA